MGESLELPGGERVGERELDREDAVLVRRERRQKERRLDQVFSRGRGCRGRRLARRLVGAICRFVLLDLLAVLTRGPPLLKAVHCRRILRQAFRRRGRGHRHRVGFAEGHAPHHAATKPSAYPAAEWRAKRSTELAIRQLRHLHKAGREAAEDLVEAFAGVREGEVQPARLAAEEAHQPVAGPLVRGERIERLVVKSSHHLGEHRCRRPRDRISNAGNLGPPDLLRTWLQPTRESFPRDRQFLVGPGHIDRL